MKTKFVLAAALAAVCVGQASAQSRPGPAEMAQVADGHVYYHRVGASLEAHNAALLQCIADTSIGQTGAATAGMRPFDAIAGSLIWDGPIAGQASGRAENCMIARGWRVYRLPATQGRELERLSDADLSARMADMVGRATPTGELARRTTTRRPIREPTRWRPGPRRPGTIT